VSGDHRPGGIGSEQWWALTARGGIGVIAQRTANGETTTEVRYFRGTVAWGSGSQEAGVRSHWGSNQLHGKWE